MSITNQRWIAALIAAHPNHQVVGRTRLQKEVKLLQRLGFPTSYGYSIHFYGPYSESLQTEIGLMDAGGLIAETRETSQDGNEYYILKASNSDDLPDISDFKCHVDRLVSASPVVLELAATYDAFRESGESHENALVRLRRKKGSKCDSGNEDEALKLLGSLDLAND